MIVILNGCSGIGVPSTSNPDIKLQQAERMIYENRPLMADTLISQSIEMYKENKDTEGLAEAYHAYGNLYKNYIIQPYKTIYDPTYMKSINSFQKAKKLFEQSKSEIGIVKSLVGIGMGYSIRNESNTACQYYDEALLKYNNGKRNGTITKDPQIFIKGYKNFGEIIEKILKQAKCNI